MSLKKSGYVVLVLLGISGLLSRLALAAVELNASGSTFIYPIESKWANIYERIDPSLRINYQPNG
jgi:ABC-type phosphate transport system substrate-binding protein